MASKAAAEEHPAARTYVDLELVLAVDVSWSMDIDEQVLQREGYVDAFRHPEVIEAIAAGELGRIAVTYVEWAGSALQLTRVPWTLIDGGDAAHAFATRLEQAPLGRMRRTSISAMLERAPALFEENEFEGTRLVVDVSGDGPNNMGNPVLKARERVLASGAVINGLPIMIKGRNPGGFFSLPDLDKYYEDCVIGGPGAFVVTVADPSEFTGAIRRKLVMEIADLGPRAPLPAPQQEGPPVVRRAQFVVDPGPSMDCLIGEKQWQEWQRGRW